MQLDGSFYLVLRARHRGPHDLSARLTDRPPSLKPGEVAVKMDVAVPEALFQRPVLQAKITVPASRTAGPVISADVAENIADIVKQETGLDLRITVEPSSGLA